MSTAEQTEPQSSGEEYERLLASGIRNLVCKEIQLAVNQLQEACSLISKKYGETADECAEVYYQYGVSLLELSRMESGVLGNALEGITEEEGSATEEESFVEQDATTEEEKEKISEEILDAMLETPASDPSLSSDLSASDKVAADTSGPDPTKITEGGDVDGPVVEVTVDSSGTKSPVKESGLESAVVSSAMETCGTMVEESAELADKDAAEESQEEGEDSSEEGEEDLMEADPVPGSSEEKPAGEEEDVSNIQLAWEMLELAKNIYKRREEKFVDDDASKKESMLKQADCLIRLGEVSLETEQYLQSVEDFNTCREILEKIIEPNNRRLAEIHYQIGVALCFATLYEEAIISYQKSLGIIGERIKFLESQLKDGGEDQAATTKEIEELKELIPDIKTKIEDALEEQRSAPTMKEAILENVATTTEEKPSEGFSNSSSEGAHPVANISHLVRKKRKPEEEAGDSLDDSMKKQKTEETQDEPTEAQNTEGADTNGTSTNTNGTNGAGTNGHTNGATQHDDVDMNEVVDDDNKVAMVTDAAVAPEKTIEEKTEQGSDQKSGQGSDQKLGHGSDQKLGHGVENELGHGAKNGHCGTEENGIDKDSEMIESLPEKSLPERSCLVGEAGDSVLAAV